MHDLPTKKMTEMRRSSKTDYDTLKDVSKQFLDSDTGVEMEALVGVSIALNTLWDMVKYLEKDEMGQYPKTRITDIRVIKKEKNR